MLSIKIGDDLTFKTFKVISRGSHLGPIFDWKFYSVSFAVTEVDLSLAIKANGTKR